VPRGGGRGKRKDGIIGVKGARSIDDAAAAAVCTIAVKT